MFGGSTASQIAAAYPRAGAALAQAIVDTSRRLGIPDAGWLANLINFESAGTFSPSAENPSSGATGLIQFMPSTAAGMGTSTATLASMTQVGQMAWVERYLSQYAGRGFTSPTDLYMAVFYPVSMGNPDYQFPSNVVAANAGISTPREYAEKANRQARLPTGMLGVEILDTGVRILPFLFTGSALLLLAALYIRSRKA
jgi:hypothetical protein